MGGFSDGATVPVEDLVVFEIRYADRVGENYFSRHSDSHKWYYPKMTWDEAAFPKVWDSRGRGFCDRMPGAPFPESEKVPVTFSLHSAFEDPATPAGAPDRESMEVRTIVF